MEQQATDGGGGGAARGGRRGGWWWLNLGEIVNTTAGEVYCPTHGASAAQVRGVLDTELEIGIDEFWGRWPWENAALSTGKTTRPANEPLSQVLGVCGGAWPEQTGGLLSSPGKKNLHDGAAAAGPARAT